PGRQFLPLPATHGELLFAIEPIDLLVVDQRAAPAQEHGQSSVAKSTALRSELDELRTQRGIIPTAGAGLHRRPRRSESPHRAALVAANPVIKPPPRQTAGSGRYHFRCATALSICTSSVRSATSVFIRRFSSSRLFSRRVSLPSSPPYLAFQR